VLFTGANAGAGAVPAFEDLIFEANDALSAGALDPGAEANNLYEWHGGSLSLVNVLPPGAPEPNANASFGAPRLTEKDAPDLSHVISADGGRIFWTDKDTGKIYVRINASTTAPVSAGAATYWTATPDGEFAYYAESGELWRYDVATTQARKSKA
jgi:hypothetical protein